jgi:hypothetical protein
MMLRIQIVVVFVVGVADGFRVDRNPGLFSSSSLLPLRPAKEHDQGRRLRRCLQPSSFDLIRLIPPQTVPTSSSVLCSGSTSSSEAEHGEDDGAAEPDEEDGVPPPTRGGASGARLRSSFDPAAAALFSLDRDRRGSAAARAHERSLQNRNQMFELLSTSSSSSPSPSCDGPEASRALDGASTTSATRRLDPILADDTATDDFAGDDDDDGLSVVLDADEYVLASHSNARSVRDEVMMMTAASPYDNSSSNDDSASGRMIDESTMNDWAVDLDPAYRAVLETLVNVPNSNPVNRDTLLMSQQQQQGSTLTNSEGGQGPSTIQDLVRILEAQQSASELETQRAAMNHVGKSAASSAERLHELVFANEQGFWDQSDAFRKGLTDPAAARQVLAERRGALFAERNQASMRKLDDQLDQLRRAVRAAASSEPDSARSASHNRCPRCRSVLTDQDVELMRTRDTRLCPVCTAEVRLVSRPPVGPAPPTRTSTTAFFQTNVVAPLKTGNRRVYRTREQPPTLSASQTFARSPFPPDQRSPYEDSKSEPAAAPLPPGASEKES